MTLKQFQQNYYVTKDGKIFYKHHNKLKPITGNPVRGNYLQVYLPNNKRKYIHKIVAETFISNPNNYPYVQHKNRDKTDNRVENLEWTKYKGPVKVAMLNDQEETIQTFNSITEAAQATNTSPSNICYVCQGKRYKTAGNHKWKYI